MNISSVIIKTLEDKKEQCIDSLSKIKGVEVSLVEGTTIIIVIQANDTNQEVEIYRQVERTDGVISASMHYTYFEDELRDEIANMTSQSQTILNDDNIKQIKYGGDVNTLLNKNN